MHSNTSEAVQTEHTICCTILHSTYACTYSTLQHYRDIAAYYYCIMIDETPIIFNTGMRLTFWGIVLLL